MLVPSQDITASRSLFSRAFFRFLDWLQRRIARASLVGDRPIFDNTLFPWTGALEAQASGIRQELQALLQERERLPAFHEISPDVGTITSDDQWKTFLFMAYGLRSERHLARCPATARALADRQSVAWGKSVSVRVDLG